MPWDIPTTEKMKECKAVGNQIKIALNVTEEVNC